MADEAASSRIFAEENSASPISSSSSTSDFISTPESSVSYEASVSLKSLKLYPGASLSELKTAIDNCKNLIADSKQCSSERKWLVRLLIELRLHEQQLTDVDLGSTQMAISTMGHHFELNSLRKKQYCDNCSGVIWMAIQGSYICKDCNFLCHIKCVENIRRVCAHIVASEKGELEMTVCPEKGLSSQSYKCAECKTNLSFESERNKPRLCDYSGLYYCSMCHWNNTYEIPARIVHNWDWEKRAVSQATYQLLSLARTMPLINLETANVKLFNFVTELDYIRKVRNDLKVMMKYLTSCQKGISLITADIVYMSENPYLYSIDDLMGVRDGNLEKKLISLVEMCREHITSCLPCSSKGYRCELCGSKKVVLFPFNSSAISCEKCNSCFHRACWIKKHQVCPKCIRIEKRLQMMQISDDEFEDDNLELN